MSTEETTVNPDKAAAPKRPLPVLTPEQVTVAFRQLGDRLSKIEEQQVSLSALVGGLTPDNKENLLILVNDIRQVHAELHATIAFLKTILEPAGVQALDKLVKEVGAQ